MKKISVLLIALTAILFVSCDKDTEQAMYLSGQWKGDMGMYITDYYGNEYDALYTDIRFYWDHGSKGHGEQIDYYGDGPYDWQSYYFTYRIDNGVVKLMYEYDSNLDCYIYDYYMGDGVFTGRINDSKVKFTLVKLENYDNWNLFDEDGYGCLLNDDYTYYDYYYEYYYGYGVKSRATRGDSAIVKRGSHLIDASKK